jgi:cysteate synthase
MRLYPSQNDPFTIIYDSWKLHSRQILEITPDDARRAAATIDAKVLSNRKPPYSLAGGLFDAMEDAGGDMFKVTNEQLRFWKKRFMELEGIDIHPAPGVALASLIKMVEAGEIDKDACIMLNITGCGEERAKKGKEIYYLKPSKVFSLTADFNEIINYAESMF